MSVSVMAVGDLIVDRPDPDYFFGPSAPVLAQADVVIGQLEVPHTHSQNVASIDVPATPADPAHLAAIARAGFDILTLAGNHIGDFGREGIVDTIRHAEDAGIPTTGAGIDVVAARQPAVLERNGMSVGVLSYNCVGPMESWASSKQAGPAYVSVMTHYEPIGANPGGPPRIYTFADPASLAAMKSDIEQLAAAVDVVVVALHKGIGHIPAKLADYETVVARAAVDAGATVVVSHHAHIMRGVELYRGRPIFHGLGNFVTVTEALSSDEGNAVERRAWAQLRRELFGFEPDPAMPSYYPFHPESRNTAIAVVTVTDEGDIESAVVPCWIDDNARPVPVGDDEVGRGVVDYLRRITAAEGFDTGFRWKGDRVVIESREHRDEEQR